MCGHNASAAMNRCNVGRGEGDRHEVGAGIKETSEKLARPKKPRCPVINKICTSKQKMCVWCVCIPLRK